MGPDGHSVPKEPIKASRLSETAASTTSCEDSRHLQDQIDNAIKVIADNLQSNNTHHMNGSDSQVHPTMDPVAKEDKGTWASEEEVKEIENSPGEFHSPASPSGRDEETPSTPATEAPKSTPKKTPAQIMEAQREKLEILDMLDYLKQLLVKLMRIKMNDLCTVKGTLSFTQGCEWDDAATSNDIAALKQTLAEAAEIEPEQVIVAAHNGLDVNYILDPSPDTLETCTAMTEKLSSSIISGFLASSLKSQTFSCNDRLTESSHMPAVVMDKKVDLAAKVAVVDNLEKIFLNFVANVDPDSVQKQVIADVNELEHLMELLVTLRSELGTAVRRDLGPDLQLVLGESNTIVVLENTITLILSYLRTGDLDLTVVSGSKITQLLTDQKSKCQQQDLGEGEGCARTMMKLSSMPLRDLDDERYDPVLQRQLGNSMRAPSGVAISIEGDLPKDPTVDHVPYAEGDSQGFWMPDDCVGDGCGEGV